MWAKYGKALISLLFFIWTVVAPLITGDGHIDADEGLIIAVAVANGLLVYLVPLNPSWAAGKTVINAILASLAAAQTVIYDGLQPNDWTIIIGAGLTLLIGWYAPTISLQHTTKEVEVGSGLNA